MPHVNGNPPTKNPTPQLNAIANSFLLIIGLLEIFDCGCCCSMTSPPMQVQTRSYLGDAATTICAVDIIEIILIHIGMSRLEQIIITKIRYTIPGNPINRLNLVSSDIANSRPPNILSASNKTLNAAEDHLALNSNVPELLYLDCSLIMLRTIRIGCPPYIAEATKLHAKPISIV